MLYLDCSDCVSDFDTNDLKSLQEMVASISFLQYGLSMYRSRLKSQ